MPRPPKYVPRPTCPPKRVIGCDGVTRIITYYVDGDTKSVRVVDTPIVPCPNVPVYSKSRRMRAT